MTDDGPNTYVNALVRAYQGLGKDAYPIFQQIIQGGAPIDKLGLIVRIDEKYMVKGNALAAAAYYGVTPVME